MSKLTIKPIKLLPGNVIRYKGDEYAITDILDLETVLARNISSGSSRRIPVVDITPHSVENGTARNNNLAVIKDDDWREANRRFEIINPILNSSRGQRVNLIKQISKTSFVSQATLYRWISAYEAEERISSLIRPTRKDKGGYRLSEDLEKIISKHIRESYLTDQRLTPFKVWEKIKGECRDLNLTSPHLNTVRNRIDLLSDEEKTLKRYGRDAARNKYKPTLGHFPGADYPLAVAQIDHTPMDIIIVSDDEDRVPICKPNLTLCLDVHSKVVLGYYIGLDPVGALSTGLCLSHAILPKESWLAKMDITTPYPVWGKMRVIHSDNAKEFRGTMLETACKEHDISPERRPKGQPQYGGNIERSFRTFMSEVHNLPGTTRSNVKDKGDYDSEGRSCMTLSALIQWFAIYIVEYYHHQPHKGNNGVPPIIKYEKGLLGDNNQPGIGLPQRIADEYKFKLDFMPYKERTVQEYGVLLENIFYYHDSLRRWINTLNPNSKNNKRVFICRYDPRDMSKIYFYEPDTKSYIEVPYRDITHPAVSLWEIRAAKEGLRDEGYTSLNEDLIFGAIKKMNAIVETEKAKTKAARKLQAKKKTWAKAKDHISSAQSSSTVTATNISQSNSIFSEPIIPYDDIEEAM